MKWFALIVIALVIAVPGAAGAQGRTPPMVSPAAPSAGAPSGMPPAAAPGRPANPATATPPATSPGAAGVPAASPVTSVPSGTPIPSDYVIGPGDILQITVWKNETLSRVVPVRPDGKISMPLLHDVSAAGLTAMQLRDKISRALGEFLPNPEVAVAFTNRIRPRPWRRPRRRARDRPSPATAGRRAVPVRARRCRFAGLLPARSVDGSLAHHGGPAAGAGVDGEVDRGQRPRRPADQRE